MTQVTQSATLATIPSGVSIATDPIAGVDFQRVKIATGDTGTAVDVSTGNPFSVSWSTSLSQAVIPTTQWTVTTIPSSQTTVKYAERLLQFLKEEEEEEELILLTYDST